jgi:hypothetical protein
MYGPKVFLLTKLNPEYSEFMYNTTHFTGPLVCRIRQVPVYLSWQYRSCTTAFNREVTPSPCDFLST